MRSRHMTKPWHVTPANALRHAHMIPSPSRPDLIRAPRWRHLRLAFLRPVLDARVKPAYDSRLAANTQAPARSKMGAWRSANAGDQTPAAGHPVQAPAPLPRCMHPFASMARLAFLLLAAWLFLP